MQKEDEAGRTGSRGRVVMLVDNGVERDSRVQKQAMYAAAAGWEVHLIGFHRGKKKKRWTLGEANVMLVPLGEVLNKPRYRPVRSMIRRPLAYGHPDIATYRRRLAQSRRAELAASRLEPGASRPVRRTWLLGRRVAAKVQQRWIGLRARQTDSLTAARNSQDSPLEKFMVAVWLKLLGDRAWRVLDRGMWDWEAAYGKVIDELEPDIIHGNDFRMLAIGARATLRARARGRQVKFVWDAHEYLPGVRWNNPPRWHPAMIAMEREYAPVADAIVTVSEPLAEWLVEEHGLKRRPAVVLNAPVTDVEVSADQPVPDMREMCGIDADTPLAVYSGGATKQRGLDIIIETLPRLPGLHVALIVPSSRADYVKALMNRATELGVRDRVTLLPFVPFDQVVPFLSAADFGIHPLHHLPNHEIALATKFFEYAHARLPIVVSDVKAMSDVVKETGHGEVFTAEDEDDFVRAVTAVMQNLKKYRDVYDERPDLLHQWTWPAQAEILDAVYTELLPSSRTPAVRE
ncbi:glycosyltransferase family 4 protein [Actinomadura sp. KC216]|uniref:glycosyltransferase family 4 protein n=1 Tax=Actinomadura sp. KC216 TaxID=2530370 RepID=UPI001A9D04A6|nr:glycosyltransferase family 4 protein [Actinomadura sp. KC216]